MARVASNSTRDASAFGNTVRLGRRRTGRKNATAELDRQPLSMLSWYDPTPKVVAPLKSGLRGSPNSAPALTHASQYG